MAGHPHLLVPVALEALVVNRNDQTNTLWSVSRREFDGPQFKAPVEPFPFVRGNDRPRIGVTLHWSLPDAITRGRRDGSGKLLFPFIPNRWLVVRNPTKGARVAQVPAAWIIESDFLDSGGTNLYPGVDQLTVTRLGRSFPLTGPYDDSAGAHAPFLTATGGYATSSGDPIPGDDPAFAASVGGIDNVLSFYDSLADLKLFHDPANPKKDDPAGFSYFVMGWHNTAGADPLDRLARVGKPWAKEDEWKALVKEYEWSVAGVAADGALPRLGLPVATLYHGAVYGVRWNGRDRGAPQPFTGGSDSPFAGSQIASRALEPGRTPAPRVAQPPRNPHLPHIAIGNSAVDAMAALIDYLTDSATVPGNDADDKAKEGQRRALGRLVQAIEYNALDRYNQPGGRIAFDDEVHSAWFHPVNRGSYWEILQARDPDKKPEDKQASLDAPLQALLDALNARQRELDVAELRFSGTQRQLYECAWKLWRLSSDPKPANAPALESAQTTARAALAPRAKTQQTERGATRAARDAAKIKAAEAVEAANAKVPPRLSATGTPVPVPGLELRQAAGARYHQPADPVVLVYGMKRSLTKHGEDGRFTSDGKLTCRVTEQTLSAFQFEARTLTRAHVEEAFSVGTIAANLPARLAAPAGNLLVEWLLLDPLAQSDLAEKSGVAAPVLGVAQGIVWADFTDLAIPPEQMVNVAGFTGTRPSPLAVDRWAQPWAPLYLSWRVAWFPSAPGKSVTEALTRWDFNGIEYDWVGIADSGNDDAFTLQGRSLLSATTAQTTLDALKDLEEAANKTGAGPTATQVDELRAQLESIDLMAQTLTGFHDLLARRNPYFQVTPSTLGTALGTADPALLEGVNNAAPMPFDNPGRRDFQAFRAGHFRLLRLWVVDAFGQVFDPILERVQSPESFVPLRGSGLAIQLNGNPSFTTARAQRKDTQQLQLPPRLLQAARLEARFERDDDPSLPALCGWLLPNHFDKSLAVYDREGELLGALLQSGSAEAPLLRWDPSVTGPVSVPSPGLIQDAQLRGFVEGLAAARQPAGAFNDLIETIDRTLWGIDPLGQRGGNLSVLIGRPIAVARMSLQLELEREPLTDPSWNAAAGDSRELARAQFPVAIGHDELRDDGTLGYFTDGYGTFHALHPFKADSTYVVRADVREDVRLSPNWLGRAVPSPPAWITVLCDPRGSIHLRTGILPTVVLRLPRELVERPLRRMDVTFRVGPLLHEPEGLEMPLPAEISGGWSWIQRSGINGLVESPVADASHHARMSDTPIHIREGWLRLSDAIGRTEEE